MRFPLHALLALAAIAAVGCAGTPLPERAPVAASPIQMQRGEWRTVDQVFVVTDASGTMYMKETFPEAKSLSRGFIRALPDASQPAKNPRNYQAAVIGFGGEDRVEAPLGPFNRSALEAKAQEVHIMGDLHGRGGTTPLHKVFGEIQTDLEGAQGKAAVVLFSDGLPDHPDEALKAARQLAESRSAPVCFHGVQTGDDPEGTTFLTELSRVTSCGSVSRAASVDNPAGLERLARVVVTGQAPPPPVAAAPPSACEGVVRLRGIEFGFDRAEITDDSAVVLGAAADRLRECRSLRVTIDGYTDSTGPEAYNEGLSVRRADAVRDYLVREGIDAGRLSTRGFGESDPIAPNDTRDGRARNRRVEMVPSQ